MALLKFKTITTYVENLPEINSSLLIYKCTLDVQDVFVCVLVVMFVNFHVFGDPFSPVDEFQNR